MPRPSAHAPTVAIAAALGILAAGSPACRPPAPAATTVGQVTAGQVTAGQVGGTEILWDRWGVPHILAPDDSSLFHAFGWAHAQSHADLLLALYAQSRGRAAELWGEDHVASDRWIRINGIPARAREWYALQSPAARRDLDAFARGITEWARRHPERVADSVEAVLPVTGPDVLAHALRVLHYTFVTSRARVDRLVRGGRPAPAAAGSNAWAVGPARSASGHALLLVNPHLPWAGEFTWFEAHLQAPGVNLSGVTLVGMPVLPIAFNDHLGWTHTVNTYDGADVYRLALVRGGYRWDGGVHPFAVVRDTLRVRTADGGVRAEVLTVKHSVHGPVVAERGDTAYALRVAGLDRPGALEQWWAMGRARTLAEFEAALRRLQIPMFTVLYADREGHVLHLFNGLVPRRPGGDWDAWSGVVSGEDATLLWTDYLPYDALPRWVDPPSGWLQNANDPPWTATLPVTSPAAYPAYLAPPPLAGPRSRRSIAMLAGDRRITAEELLAYKQSTRLELADRVVDSLVALVTPTAPLQGATHGNGRVRHAGEVLAQWDRTTDAESRGAVLFEAFWREYERRVPPARRWATPWRSDDPLGTPRGLADTTVALAALDSAAALVVARYGRLDVAWGDVHRLVRDSLDLPASGGPDPLGAFRVLELDPSDHEGRRLIATGGESWVALVEFARPVRARALLAYGNASQPGSPHRTDQLPLFARKALRPVLRTRAEIEAHLERRERL